jgi:transposase
VREVAERLGVSTKSIYTWQKLFSRPAKVVKEVDAQADESNRTIGTACLSLGL